MCGVIHAIQERNLLLVVFHLHILSIDHQRATEAFSVAIVVGDLVVVGKLLEFFNDPSVCRTNTNMSSMSKGTNTCSLEMKTEKRFVIFATVIDVEPYIAFLAVKSVYSSSCSLFPDMIGRARRTMWTTAL